MQGVMADSKQRELDDRCPECGVPVPPGVMVFVMDRVGENDAVLENVGEIVGVPVLV